MKKTKFLNMDRSLFCAVGCEYEEVEDEKKLSRVVVLDLYGNLKCDLYIDTGDKEASSSNANQTTKEDAEQHPKISEYELFQRLKENLTRTCISFNEVPRAIISEIGFPATKYDYFIVDFSKMLDYKTLDLLDTDLKLNTKVALLTHNLIVGHAVITALPMCMMLYKLGRYY